MDVVIGVVILRRAPFQIIHPVVGFILVLVVNQWEVVRVWYECVSDKPMNHHLMEFAAFVKSDYHITIFAHHLL